MPTEPLIALVPEPVASGLADRAGVVAYAGADSDAVGTGQADDALLDPDLLATVGFYVPAYMGPPATLALMGRMPRLEACQLLTAGFDGALGYLPPGVTLCNAGRLHDASTAELAVALVLASLRRIDDFARAMPVGAWRAGRYDALADRRVLVIGYGGIGRAIASRLRPFEATVTAVARSPREDDGVVVEPVGRLDALLPQADVVIVCVPLDDSTRSMVDSRFLSLMRDGSLLVNVARGGVADTDAILREAGRLRFALDVTDPEPLPPDHPLWRAPGVLISPHVGGNSSAFLPRAIAVVEAQLRRWRRGEPLEHVVC